MARKAGSTIPQEELYPLPDELVREEQDERLLDLEVEQESPFLRGQKRVSVRRGSLPKKTATRLAYAGLALLLVCVFAGALAALYNYGEHSWRFRVESSDDIEISGLQNVTRSQVLEVMGGDIGRNIFFVPLAQRQKQLQQIPWVESASVMRFVPNRLRIEIHERRPVAFARVGSKISLIDADGTLMDLPMNGKRKYSFPVILGMNSGEPLSTRASRMKIYNDLVSQLDAGGTHYSQDLSEVDVSDPDDVKVMANDPRGEVLVHLGSSDYLERYRIYIAHVQEWRQQFEKLESVDLRYDHQIIVNPDLQTIPKQAALPLSMTKAAVAAGVRPAVLVSHEIPQAKTTAPVATSPQGNTLPPTAKTTPPSAKRGAKLLPARRKVKFRHHTPRLRHASAKTRLKTDGAGPQKVATATSPTATTKTSSTTAAVGAVAKTGKPSPAIPKGQDNQ